MTKEMKKAKNPLMGEEVEETTEEETVEDEVEESEKAPAKKSTVSAKVVAPKENADEALLSDIHRTKKILEREEKIHFMIPLAEGEKPGSAHDCFINGAKYTVPKGVMTMVPRSVAELLAEHYRVGMSAGLSNRLDMNAEKQDALS